MRSDGRVFRSVDGGQRWVRTRTEGEPGGAPTALLPMPRGLVLATTAGLFHAARGHPWNLTRGPACVAVALAPWGRSVYAGTLSEGTLRSDDGGTTWTGDTAGLPFGGAIGVHALAARGPVLVAAHALGLSQRADVAAAWGPSGAGLPLVGRRLALASAPDALYAESEGRLYGSPDGSAWVEVYDGPGRGRPLTLLGAAGASLFATTETGVLYQSSGGTTWQAAGDGLPGAPSSVVASATSVLAALGPHGVWRRSLPVGSDRRAAQPFELTLAPNDPNPFSDETWIAFSLSAPAEVTLSILDLFGAEVARVAEGPFGSGGHRIGVHAGALPAGIYRYRLSAAGQSQARPMVVFKGEEARPRTI